MYRSNCFVVLTALVCILGLGAPGYCNQAQYTVTDLGMLPEFAGTLFPSIYLSARPSAINNNGQITGWCYNARTGVSLAFLYQNGTMSSVGTLGGTSSWALGINSAGEVVGRSNTSTPATTDPFIYAGGTMTDLGSVGGGAGTFNEAYGINDPGDIVGGFQYAFLYSHGVVQNLGTLRGGSSSAYGINSSDEVVGESDNHAFLYRNGAMADLGTLGGALSSALAINSSGQIVGWADVSGMNNYHAFLLNNGTMIDLGAGDESSATAINSRGAAVGTYASGAFLYQDGVLQNLNGLLPSNSDWTELNPTGINDEGQIVGIGNDGALGIRGFLMTPASVPEPGAMPLVALLVLLAALGRTRRATQLPTASCIELTN